MHRCTTWSYCVRSSTYNVQRGSQTHIYIYIYVYIDIYTHTRTCNIQHATHHWNILTQSWPEAELQDRLPEAMPGHRGEHELRNPLLPWRSVRLFAPRLTNHHGSWALICLMPSMWTGTPPEAHGTRMTRLLSYDHLPGNLLSTQRPCCASQTNAYRKSSKVGLNNYYTPTSPSGSRRNILKPAGCPGDWWREKGREWEANRTFSKLTTNTIMATSPTRT